MNTSFGRLACISSLLLAACGGAGTSDSSSTPTPGKAVNGVVMKGPLQAAQVQLFAVDGSGDATGAALVTLTTDANGHFSFDRAGETGSLLAVTRGGSFVDEADPQSDPARKRRFTLGPDQGFESLLPAESSTLVITPYTHALLLRARRLSNGFNFVQVHDALRAQASRALGFDPSLTMPEPPLAPSASASLAARNYAMMIGGIAQVINAQALELGSFPSFETVLATITDLSDGRIDGLRDGLPISLVVNDQSKSLMSTNIRLNEQIGRFRNNNDAVYAGMAMAAVNEAQLAQLPPNLPAANHRPVANPDFIAITQGSSTAELQSGASSLLANDSDPETPAAQLLASLVMPPAHGTVTVQPNGSFLYSHDDSRTTSDSFSYRASDGSLDSNVALVSISIELVDRGPGLSIDDVSVGERRTATIDTPGNAIRGNPGFSSNTLARNDDSSTGVVPIGFEVNFFGLSFTSLFVNNNGNVTFDSPLSTFSPFNLTTTDRQIIAPFFTDIDTRCNGLPVTYGNDTVDGHPAFGVNWVDVDEFSCRSASLLNRIQLVLISRADISPGAFEIEFNYDRIVWDHGNSRAGYANGTIQAGTFFELVGSGTAGAFLDSNLQTGLVYNSLGTSLPGRYRFQARDGSVTSPSVASFTVSLAAPSTTQVTVDFTTQDGTALAGQDYEAASGQLLFPPGVTSRMVDVTILNDSLIEPDESFSVVLSNPQGGRLARSTGLGTIIDDDSPR